MSRPLRSWVQLAVVAALVVVLALVVALVSTRRASGPADATTPRAAGASSQGSTTARAPSAVCGSPQLQGPSRPPDGAVVVRTSQHLGRLTEASPPGTTFWLEPGRHVLGDGEYDQVAPKDGNRYVGAPGAVLDGRRTNLYAFTGKASRVRIEHLTITRFGPRGGNSDAGVVNHDGGPGWVLTHLTVKENAGAGVMLGSGTVLEDSCLADNGQYGFSAYSPDGVRDVTLRDNEITGNNTDDWERRTEGCGCTGGGKFWATRGARVTGNNVHDNRGVGIWADTNNAGFLIEGNHFTDNDDSAIVYETSYNAAIVGNTFERNALRSWRNAPGFPVAAVYLSEYANPRVRRVVKPIVEVLASIPSVVVGYFAIRFIASIRNSVSPM